MLALIGVLMGSAFFGRLDREADRTGGLEFRSVALDPIEPTPDPRFSSIVICLDPGHGGWDPGFEREGDKDAPAMREATYTLAFAEELRLRLEARGFLVVLTRDSDLPANLTGGDVNGDGETHAGLIATNPWQAKKARELDELQARINICNGSAADLLVSMHINGFDEDTGVSGFEAWYSSVRPFGGESKRFATIAFDELGTTITGAGYNARARRVVDDAEADAAPEGDSFDHYVVIGPAAPGKIVPSTMPGAIVESLFLSNDGDARFLASEAGKSAIVTAYERAIVEYFGESVNP